ncbi:MAG: VWA domain-containing protein [Planctomycetota bacterium]|nr:MAG: VWA domain-containing protein [Planctomycetota bacterium]
MMSVHGHGVALLVDELATLARQIAGVPGLGCDACPQADSWSFNWVDQHITMPESDLRCLPADECRALVLHEAGHAALTRLHQVVPIAQHRSHATLLNVFEDTRLETWLMRESSDFARWLRAVNDRLYADTGEPSPSLCHAFANECLFRWWFGEDHGRPVPPMAAAALYATRQARHQLTICIPTSSGFSIPTIELQRCQRQFWEIIRRDILPHWQRLLTEDRRLGNPALSPASTPHIAGILPDSAAHSPSPGQGAAAIADDEASDSAAIDSDDASPSQTDDPGTILGRSRQQSLATYMGEPWAQAWRATAHRSLALAAVLRRLHAPHGTQLSPPGLMGSHLHWPSVVASQADPRHRMRLWQRRTPRTTGNRPAVWLMVDRSQSMRGSAMTAAWQGMVLCAETCERASIPWGLSVFNEDHQVLHQPGQSLTNPHRRWMGANGAHAAGGTNLTRALDQVIGRLRSVSDGTRLIILLTDARLPRRVLPRLHDCIERAEASGDTLVTLLLKRPAPSMRNSFPRHQCISNPTHIPERLTLLLRDYLG